MVFGTTTFKCDNCGERFEGIVLQLTLLLLNVQNAEVCIPIQ